MPTALLKALRAAWRFAPVAWRLAPWIVLAVVALRWWCAPAAGSSAAPGQTVIVAGKDALTTAAQDWKEPPPSDCEPAAGDPGRRFIVQTREPSAEELERLARQYGFTFGDRELTADLAGMPIPPYGGKADASDPVKKQAIARMFGEYTAPTLRYGGTFAAGLLVDGELETRFDPAPSPRLGFPMVWGGGAEYDATSGLSQDERHHRLYAFLEPIQTKQLYWRVSAGAEQIIGPDLEPKWDPRFKVGAEWRSEPWIRKNKGGLRAVKLPE